MVIAITEFAGLMAYAEAATEDEVIKKGCDVANLRDPESQSRSEQGDSGPLDSAAVAGQMKAINAAMKHYFDAEDWLRERSRVFPGMGRRTYQTHR